MSLYLVACCILLLNPNEAARILAVFPVPSISHQVVFRPLTQELASRGHEITIITPDPVFSKGEGPSNLTEIDVHDVSYNIWKEKIIKAASKGSKSDLISQLNTILRTFAVVFDAQLQTAPVQKLINDKSKKFDLLLLEACMRPALAFSYVYKNVPVILVSSLGAAPGNYDLIGAPDHPLLYPSMINQRVNNLSFWDKITELYNHYRISKDYDNCAILENKLLQKNFGPNIPPVKELLNNVDMLFLNINPMFEGIRPVPPSVIFMGGIHQKTPKELPTLKMAKTKNKLTKEEKLAKDRLRKKEKYEQIKSNPELYAIQKEKERKRYVLRKEQNKIYSIKDMASRAQRDQRKKWRINSKKYLKKKEDMKRIEKIIIDNSPPDSEIENNLNENRQNSRNQEPLEVESARQELHQRRRRLSHKFLIRKLHYRYQKKIRGLKEEVQKLKKENYNLKRKQPIDNILQDSIQKRVDALVKDIKGERVEEIKKKLLFGETISKNLKEEYKTLDKKHKRVFVNKVVKNRDRLKKYRVLNSLPFSLRPTVPNKENIPEEIPHKIIRFFEEDANSRMTSGIKEYVKQNGVKKQKRYLTDSMKNLHIKFTKEVLQLSYSTFCKYRPFWVMAPNTRDTCLCKLHANVDLLIVALKRANITKEGSSSDILKSICCKATDEKCLDRSCQLCGTKVIAYNEFENDKRIFFDQWLTEKQSYIGKDGRVKHSNVTTKKKLHDYPRTIVHKLESILPKFMQHVNNIIMQFESLKELKLNLRSDEILIHIDFSENYCLKYNEEIQSFHFGGSRGQVSLHTGVLYFYDIQTSSITTKSFCTVSKCLQHNAAAVWAHLKPILNMTKELVPSTKVIHFLSDSPTSQYRNKYVFYLITKIKDQLPGIENVTWNYQEAGHGKGAPDGIGAVVKRTADSFVKNGGDVGSFETFVEVVTQNVTNVAIKVIEEDQIKNIAFPKNIPTFRGTMSVHQDIKSYLDSSKDGVIYISFGTNVAPSMLPPDRIQTLVRVFSQLPYDVLWKWDKDELPGRTENIKISKWLPQPDLLRHPKVKVFITQGGLQSTDEAITAGVPLIGLPMLADQWFNVEKYVYLKIGVQLDLETLTEEQFRNTITTVIEDDSYRRNIEKMRNLMQDEPMPPLERAIWWTEYVLRHGGAKHLRSPAANISWTDYLELELVFTVLIILLAMVLTLFAAVYVVYKQFTVGVNVKLKGN